jgi:hypothetical protein
LPQGGDLQRDLPKFRSLHFDHVHNPARYMGLSFLSNLRPDGRFRLSLQQEYCVPTPFTALIFTGTHPHVSYSSINTGHFMYLPSHSFPLA